LHVAPASKVPVEGHAPLPLTTVNWLEFAEKGPMLALDAVEFCSVVENVELLPTLTFPNEMLPVNDTPAASG
jgi:hypothetical protein